MPSLVPGFIIDPVLRQARRLSSNFNSPGPETPLDQTSGPSALDSSAFDDDEISGPTQDGQQAGSGLDDRTPAQGPSGLTRLFASARSFTSGPSNNAFDATRSMPSLLSRNTFPRHARTTSLQTQLEQEHEDLLVPGSSAAMAALSTSAPHGQQPHRRSNAAEIGLEDPFGGLNLADGEHILGGGDGALDLGVPASLPTGFYGNMELPEDDGMQALRRRILAVQSRDIAAEDKARMMHSMLMESYKRSRKTAPLRPMTPSSPPATAATIQDEAPAALGPLESLKFWHAAYSHGTPPPQTRTFTLTEDDIRPTYVPDTSNATTGGDGIARDEEGRQLLGCEHYRRNVKLQCFTCERWYTCRLCHNDAEEHTLPRRNTKNMLCMLCGHAQRAGDVCTKCGESAARYYCNICKLWNDDPDKSIYHCNDCGICRVGEGLGKDFFHCKCNQKCGSCIAINQEESHRCREGVMDCDCPICGEYIFTTHKKVVTMKCGHMIHDDCRAQYIKRSYKCPICNKSVENMESMFRRLDKHLEEQPMPEEYANTRAVILCNDCEAKTSTTYHWGGLRCEVCLSYNTVELLLLNPPVTHNGQGVVDEAEATAIAAEAEAVSGAAGHAANDSNSTFGPLLVPAHNALLPAPSLPSPPLSSSPRSDSGIPLTHPRSPPLMSFRSASPAFMTSPTRAPVLATAPPGYTEEGFQLEGDEDDYRQSSDMEDGDILGLFDRRAALQWAGRKVSPYFGGGKKDDSDADDDEEGDDDDDDDEDKNSEEEDDDDEDDDEEEQIQLFGHR